MSKKSDNLADTAGDIGAWSELLKETREEYLASPELTEDEKRFLDELESLPEGEWEPVTCEGKPASETIIKERGPK